MAGLLGQIFSAGNVAKRQLRDLLGNPVLGAQQMAGNLNDRARNLNEMTSAAAREGVNYGPATQRLAGLMAEGYNPMGLTVFHGSPAKFNKFDRTKIGSGEGAQAYGYGHYVAQSPEVAKSYQEGLSGGAMKMLKSGFSQDPELWAAGQLYSKISKPDIKEGLEILGYKGDANKLIQSAEKRMETELKAGNLYEIDLPDEQIARMLDYNKLLKDQPQEIQNAIKPLIEQTAKSFPAIRENQELTGYGLLQAYKGHRGGNAEAVSEALREAGIPGIRYLDDGSRGAGKGTQNFVVFPGNEDLLTILRRNGGLLD